MQHYGDFNVCDDYIARSLSSEAVMLGKFKIHPVVALEVLPPVGLENNTIPMVNAMHSLLSDSYFPELTTGQPVAGFELYADVEHIKPVFVVPEGKAEFFRDRLITTFKNCHVKLAPQYMNLRPEWCSICGVKLRDHYIFALRLNDASIIRSLVDTVDNLVDGERALVQILFEPLDNDWRVEGATAYKRYLQGEELRSGLGFANVVVYGAKALADGVQSVTAAVFNSKPELKEIKPDIKPLIDGKKKLNQQAFRVSIKLVVESASTERRERILQGLVEAFKYLSNENHLVRDALFLKRQALQDLALRRMPLTGGSILCVDEIANMIKLPDDAVTNPKVERVNILYREVDRRVTEGGILIGHTSDRRGKREPVYFVSNPVDDYAKPRVYTSAMGGGKTTAAENFAKGVALLGDGCSVFDVADGKLAERVLRVVPKQRHDDIVFVDFSNINNPPVFNFSCFAQAGLYAEDDISLMFTEFFKEFFGTASYHRTNNILKKAALSVFSEPGSTFLELVLMLTRPEFREKFIERLKTKNKRLYMWWQTDFNRMSEGEKREILGPVLARLDEFMDLRRLRNIFCARGGKLNPRQWMDEGKIVIYKIPKGVFNDYEIKIIMAFINYAYWAATLSRQDVINKGIEPKPHHLIFDEPQDYFAATTVFERAFAQSRKYRVSYNMFFQSADQIISRDPALWKIMMDNKPHLILGPTSEATAKKLLPELAPLTLQEILAVSKEPYTFVLRTFAGGAVEPFIFKTLPPTPDNQLIQREPVKAQCRKLLSPRAAQEIEEDIHARELLMSVQEYRNLLQTDTTREKSGFEWVR